MKLTTAVHKFARAVYKANRATRTADAIASGNPQRVERLITRWLMYQLFARIINRVLL